MPLEFRDRVDEIDALLGRSDLDGASLLAALRGLSQSIPTHPTADQIRSLFRVCYAVAGFGGHAAPAGLDDQTRERIGWSVAECLEPLFYDKNGDHRRYVNKSVNRSRALQTEYPGGPTERSPHLHIPLDFSEAQELAHPYLADLETVIDAQSYAHLALCWKVMEHPLPPFDRVFEAWVKDLDVRGLGLGDSHRALWQAYALSSLAREGRQRVSAKDCRDTLMPQMEDPNQMVAGCAGRFIGMLYESPDQMFNGPPPLTLPQMLDHLADLSGPRRAAAGGFLCGFADIEDPFHKLQGDPDLCDYDLDEWVLRILADNHDEAFYPGAQAFWFPVHEHYWNRPDFANCMIDAGHLWVAYMCATENPSAESGMEPVLNRLAGSDHADIAEGARRCLARLRPSG